MHRRHCHRRHRSPVTTFIILFLIGVGFVLETAPWSFILLALFGVVAVLATTARRKPRQDAPATPQGWRTHDVSLLD